MQPPKYGTKLSGLDTDTPGNILYGVTPDNKVIPIQVNDQGILSSGATFIGDITLGAFHILDTSTSREANVILSGPYNALVVTADSWPLSPNAATEFTLDSISTTLTSIDTNLSNGLQKTQIVDDLGNIISSSGNALNVNIISGGISSGTQQVVAASSSGLTINGSVSVDNFPEVQNIQALSSTGVTVNGTVNSNTYDGSGNPIGSFSGALNVSSDVVIPTQSSVNSTTTPLLGDEVFTGVGENVDGFVSIDISITTDQNSSSEGFIVQFSQDNIVFDFNEAFTIVGGEGSFFSISPRARYFRIKYTNGAVSQTKLTIQTTFYPVTRSIFTSNLANNVPQGQAVQVVKSILSAFIGGSTLTSPYTNLICTSEGVLLTDSSATTQPVSGNVSVDNFPASVAVNNYPGVQQVMASSSGGLTVNLIGTPTVNVNQPITVLASSSSGLTINGSVLVSNLPATQSVTESGIWNVNVTALSSSGLSVNGTITSKLQDGSGNNITSQASSGQRALDVGIDVAGVQVDPRNIRILTPSDIVSVQAISSAGLTITGSITTVQGTSSVSILSSLSSSISNVNLLSGNSSRKMATIFNDSTSNLFVKLGSTASTTSFTIKMAAGSYYEFPAPVYTGQVDGLWDVANGSARISELT